MAQVIDVRAVVKHFGSTVALDRLDLRVEAGEVHAFEPDSLRFWRGNAERHLTVGLQFR